MVGTPRCEMQLTEAMYQSWWAGLPDVVDRWPIHLASSQRLKAIPSQRRPLL